MPRPRPARRKTRPRGRVDRKRCFTKHAIPYASPWWLPGGHLQTIYPSLRPPPRIAMTRERWRTPDGDFIDVDFTGDPGAARVLVLFHGLEGGSDSHYARSIGAHASAAGLRVAMPH